MDNTDKSINVLRRNENFISGILKNVRNSNISDVVRVSVFNEEINASQFLP